MLEGDWSIDWLWTTDRGWVLTDMAVAEQSFHWLDCEYCPKDQRKHPSGRDKTVDVSALLDGMIDRDGKELV